MKGLVFKSTGLWYDVKLESGHFLACRIRGKMKQDKLSTTNPIAVGDIVELEYDDFNEGTGIITGIEARKNYVIRKSVHKAKQGHLIAANITQAILTVTLHHPKTSMGFIDRFLVTTDSFRIPTILVFNKSDLLSENELESIQSISSIYTPINIRTMLVSAKNNEGIDKLKTVIDGETVLLSGHSGTGKSTIINLLAPDYNQKTAALSLSAKKGRHTTTFAEMILVNNTTKIIDTPGIKELGLVDIKHTEIASYFPEMRALLGKCRYNNCIHTHEPNCAVIEAIKKKIISKSRYDSYLSMVYNTERKM